MMNTIIQYIHRPNNTELGKGNTHECYLFVKSEIDESVEELIPSGREVEFKDMQNDSKWRLKAAKGREFRINQMADLYRTYDVEYGDEVILHKHVINGETSRYASVKKVNAIGLYNLNKNGDFGVYNIDKCAEIRHGIELKVLCDGEIHDLKISFLESRKKRFDSPSSSDIYRVYINEKLQTKSMLLFLRETGNYIEDYNKYEYHKITWEE